MAVTIKHAKTDNIADWTQPDLDAQIAAGNYPPGTVLADIVLPSDWNNDHTVTGLGTMATQDANAVSITGGTMSGVAITGYIPTTQKGVANGVATLDSGGQVPLSQLPPLGDLNYQGTWNASTNSPTLTSSTGTKGYYYVVSVAGSTNLNGISDWQVNDWAVFNGSVWQKIDNTDAVTSVNGYTGTVVLNAADVGAVPYTGATAAVDLNAKSLTNVSSLGINTTTVPTIKFRAFGDNNSSSRIAMRGYSSDANSSAIRVTKFRGTYAAPQAPQSGDSLGKFELAGYGTTSSDGYPQASFEGVATEAWGATARGTKTLIKVTPNTTTTQATAVTIDQDKSVTLAGALSVTGTTTLATSLSGLAKLTSGVVSTATSGTDYAPATSGSSILYGNGSGGFSNVTIGTGVSFAGGTLSATGSGGTVTSVTGTAPVVSSGGATPAISMAAASSTVNGYLTSTDWTTFNSKGSGTVTSVSATSPVTSTGGATPTIAIPAATTSASGYLTSTDWNTFNGKGSGTVTSVAALTLGTTGTDLSSTVATGTTTPVITLNVPTASATNRGALSAADWTTFNSKGSGTVTSVTGTAPVVSSGGATPAISMAAASTSTNGYLTSTDWNTFNGKGSGTVTSTSVVSANGFAGTVATATTTPAITISTSITGVLKGNATAISAATAGTDYVAPGTATNFTAQQYFGTSTLTDGATISWAASTAQVATVTIAGNRTMAAPSGLVSGAFYALNVIQDATGSRTMTWNTVFKWTGGTAPTLSTAANAKDFFVFRSDGTNLYEQGRSLGVA